MLFRSHAEDPVGVDVPVKKGQEDQDQRGRVDDVQNRGRDGDDLVQADAGENRAEQADGGSQPGVAELPAGERGEVPGGGAAQGYGCGDAGQSNHYGEQHDARVAHEVAAEQKEKA